MTWQTAIVRQQAGRGRPNQELRSSRYANFATIKTAAASTAHKAIEMDRAAVKLSSGSKPLAPVVAPVACAVASVLPECAGLPFNRAALTALAGMAMVNSHPEKEPLCQTTRAPTCPTSGSSTL